MNDDGDENENGELRMMRGGKGRRWLKEIDDEEDNRGRNCEEEDEDDE